MLNGIINLDGNSLITQLKLNLEAFFNDGLLQAGGYQDVRINANDVTNQFQFLPQHVPGYADGTVWQAPKRNFVWENDIGGARQPIQISGVYVNSNFYPENSIGDYQHYFDYPNGAVYFDQPIPTSSIVEAEYSYRWVSFYDQNTSWFRDVIFNAYQLETGEDSLPSGVLGLLQKNAVQLPAVVIETIPSRRFQPYQLGNLSQWVYQDFLFHILAENSNDRDLLVDVVTLQQDSEFFLFDTNARVAANQYDLDWRGSKIPGALSYSQLIMPPPSGFQWHKAQFFRTQSQEVSSFLPLSRAIVRLTIKI